MSKRKQRLAQHLGPFLRQYARPADSPNDPNDRRYDRGIEEQVSRLGAEEFGALLESEEFDGLAARHEIGLAAFLRAGSRPRLTRTLRSEAGSAEALEWFVEEVDRERAALRSVPAEIRDAAALEAFLVAAGAPEVCCVFAADPVLDRVVISLTDAVRAIAAGQSRALLSCVAGRQVYHHGPSDAERRLLTRNLEQAG